MWWRNHPVSSSSAPVFDAFLTGFLLLLVVVPRPLDSEQALLLLRLLSPAGDRSLSLPLCRFQSLACVPRRPFKNRPEFGYFFTSSFGAGPPEFVLGA